MMLNFRIIAVQGEKIMARKCAICGKQAQTGSSISHAHNVTKRKFKPNLQSVRARIGGKIKKILVCTRCLRSGKVRKA
jgi:large subunit ribosomal protein L28